MLACAFFALAVWIPFFALTVPAGAEFPPLPVGIDGCIAVLRADPDDGETVGDESEGPVVGDRCLSLVESFAASPWDELLTEPHVEELTAEQLEWLQDFVADEGRFGAARAFDLGDLDVVLRQLPYEAPRQALSLWDRFVDWLASWFGDAPNPDWLAEWFEAMSISESAWDWIGRFAFLLLAGAALWIVVNELRVAGVFDRASNSAVPIPETAASRRVLGPADLARLPAEQRPAALLVALTEALRGRGVALRNSATHRELVPALAALDPAAESALVALISVAERVAYAGRRPETSEIDVVLRDGFSLLSGWTAGREESS